MSNLTSNLGGLPDQSVTADVVHVMNGVAVVHNLLAMPYPHADDDANTGVEVGTVLSTRCAILSRVTTGVYYECLDECRLVEQVKRARCRCTMRVVFRLGSVITRSGGR